jgi:hypothetical protein
MRHREALKGCNRKGTRPQLADKLHVLRVAVADGGAPRIVQHDHAVDLVEVIVAHARVATAAMSFGRVGVLG